MQKNKILRIAHIHVRDRHNKGDRAIVLAVQEQLRQAFKNCRIIDWPVEFLSKALPADIKKLNKADLVVIGGGGIFYSYFLPYSKKIIDQIQPPIVIFGPGFIREIGSPALSRDAADSVFYLVKKARLVGVRDNKTKEFLRQGALLNANIQVIGDPATLLQETKPKKFVLKTNQGKRKVLRLGLNLNYSGWLGFGKWREDILKAYCEVVDFLQKKYGGQDGRGLEVYYLQHHPGEKNIYPALAIKNLRLINLAPADQKYVYGQLDLVIGMMLHVGVMAFGAKTPEISVAYDIRNYSFAEFIRCPELVVDLDKLKEGELLKRVKKVLAAQNRYRSVFSSRKLEIERKHKDFLMEIKGVLGH